MCKWLLARLGLVSDRDPLDAFDPVYGLAKSAVEDWLSRNPLLSRQHEAALRRRIDLSHAASPEGRRRAICTLAAVRGQNTISATKRP